MSHAETILAALAAADLAEERGDYRRAASLLGQAEAEMIASNKTLQGVAPPALRSAPMPPPPPIRRPTPNGRYRLVRPRG